MGGLRLERSRLPALLQRRQTTLHADCAAPFKNVLTGLTGSTGWWCNEGMVLREQNMSHAEARSARRSVAGSDTQGRCKRVPQQISP